MKKILVCYFSATGKTKKVAQKVAEIADCESFEIEPVLKYTKEDLDWTDKNSRSTKEMEDKLSRPEIVNKVHNIDDYNTILIHKNRSIFRKDELILFFALKPNHYSKDEIINSIKKIIA